MELRVSEVSHSINTLVDFITGREIPNIGAEENRQAVERFLVEAKGYAKEDIEVDVDIEMLVAGRPYSSRIDLVAKVDGIRFMAFKCVAGSLGSWEREIIAAARLLEGYQIPYAVVSDGKSALVMDTVSGKRAGEGLAAIPSKDKAIMELKTIPLQPYPEERLEREKIIFRSYDMMKMNIIRDCS
jgi:hypothetical protein